jgi:hypothetical protein
MSPSGPGQRPLASRSREMLCPKSKTEDGTSMWGKEPVRQSKTEEKLHGIWSRDTPVPSTQYEQESVGLVCLCAQMTAKKRYTYLPKWQTSQVLQYSSIYRLPSGGSTPQLRLSTCFARDCFGKLIRTLMAEIHLNNICFLGSYLTENTCLRNKDQSVNTLYRNNPFFLWESYETRKYTLWAKCRDILC